MAVVIIKQNACSEIFLNVILMIKIVNEHENNNDDKIFVTMEGITKWDYNHANKVCNNFNKKRMQIILIKGSKKYLNIGWYIQNS